MLSRKRLASSTRRNAFGARIAEDREPFTKVAADQALIAGVLHDLGKLFLASYLPNEYQSSISIARQQGIPMWQAECEVLGTSHGGIGAYLLGLWGLPTRITEAVAFHHQPGLYNTRELNPLVAVHVANVLVQDSNRTEPNFDIAMLDCGFLEKAGTAHRVEMWRERTLNSVERPSQARWRRVSAGYPSAN